MANLIITATAQNEFTKLTPVMQRRVLDVTERLIKWPTVSGAKALRGDLAGNFRIRTGDYRVVFTVSADNQTVTVWKIGYRGSVYE